MSRQTYFLGLGMALVALAFVLTDEVVPGTPGITERNAKRVRPGMTAEEVEALFGIPSGEDVCVDGPGGYVWWQVKGFLMNCKDPQRLQRFVTRVQQASPRSFAGRVYGVDYF